jgi:EAL domain-containing protein (putative c-di-GMP-specific phosphodiesterase class I)
MIANRSLETHYQPIIDLRNGQTVGAEALARFAQLPVRPPDAWFAEAASLGVGVELELTALSLALEGLDRLPSGIYLSVNASAETMMTAEFAAAMSSVPAERLVLELTEHTRVVDYSAFADALEPLRSSGVRLAVDDAGSGFASFNHVLELRPDVIKLDISLIRGIDHDPAKQSLARALLGFGSEAFDTTFVAEGIETRAELEALQELGFHSGQGFILGRPRRQLRAGRNPPRVSDSASSGPAPGSTE